MKPTILLKTLLAGVLLTSAIQLTDAQTPGIASFDTSGYGSPGPGATGTLGFEFTLSSAGTLDALGGVDFGHAQTNEVGLWDASGDLLASGTVTIPGTAGDTDKYDYTTALTFVNGFTGVLAANTDYYVGEGMAAADPYSGGSITTSSGVTEVGYASSGGTSGFVFPSSVNATSNVSYLAANFEYTAVSAPEPSAPILLLAGVLTLLVANGAKRRAAKV